MAQNMNDLGMMGGSGVVLTPTTGITPESHFRVDMTRMNLLRSGSGALNSFAITGGLSENMEFTAKFQSSQDGGLLAPSFTGFGGKIVLPIDLPLLTSSAIWGEAASTTNPNSSVVIPSSVNRFAFILQPEALQRLHSNIFLGVTTANSAQRFAGGCNAAVIVSKFLKIGGEFGYNYYGRDDRQESMLFLFRALPIVCVQMSPGYLQSSAVSTWTFSLGVSVSTSNIEFASSEARKTEKTVVPSFDDLEKQIHDEKKDKQ